jgi:hypothetical protein
VAEMPVVVVQGACESALSQWALALAGEPTMEWSTSDVAREGSPT